MTIKTCKSKPLEYQYVQWKGDNMEEIREFLPEKQFLIEEYLNPVTREVFLSIFYRWGMDKLGTLFLTDYLIFREGMGMEQEVHSEASFNKLMDIDPILPEELKNRRTPHHPT